MGLLLMVIKKKGLYQKIPTNNKSLSFPISSSTNYSGFEKLVLANFDTIPTKLNLTKFYKAPSS